MSLETADQATAQTITLKIELLYMPYPVWRHITVSSSATLADLHTIFQTAMPFNNSHLHQFDVAATMPKGSRKRAPITSYGTPDPEGWMDIEDERATTLGDLVATGVKTFTYMYDFGDSWEHEVTIAKVEPRQANNPFVLLVEAEGQAPPDDCGGPPGFEAFLDAMTDPNHEEHNDLVGWYGKKTFNPADVPTKSISTKLAKLKPKPKK
jgi:Plasmid pRiA4b ORF-3-like protein